jgi:hypothetical protein
MFTDLCQKLIKVSKMREPIKKSKKSKKLKGSSFLEEEAESSKKCCQQ